MEYAEQNTKKSSKYGGRKLERQLKKERRLGNDDHSSTAQTVERQKRSYEDEGKTKKVRSKLGREIELPTNENKESCKRKKNGK